MILKTIPKRYSIFGNLENNVAPRLMKTGFREPTFRDSDFTALVGSRTPSQARDSTPDQGGKALSLRTRDFRTPSSWGGVLASSKRGSAQSGNPESRGSTPDQGGKGRAFWTPSSWGGILDSSRRGATLFLRFPKIMLRFAMVFKIKLISGYFKVILGHFGIEARKSECEILLSFSFVNQRKSLVNIVFSGHLLYFFDFFWNFLDFYFVRKIGFLLMKNQKFTWKSCRNRGESRKNLKI